MNHIPLAHGEALGRFASHSLKVEGVMPLLSPCPGRRFDRIELRMTVADFEDQRVHEWIRRVVLPRVANPYDFTITIEVIP